VSTESGQTHVSGGLAPVRGGQPAFIALLDQAVMSGTTLLTGVLVARGTTVEEFGGFTLVLVLLIWVTGIHAALVTTPYMYQWRKHPEPERPLYEGSVMIQHLFIASVAVVAILLSGTLGFANRLGGGVGLAIPVCVICTGALVRDYARMTAYAHQKFGHALRLDLGISCFQVVTLILIGTTGGLTLSLVFLAVGVPQIVLSLISLRVRPAPSQINSRHIRSTTTDHWAFGRWLLAGVTVNTLIRDAYPWLLATFFGVAAAGHYAAHANVAFLAGPAVVGFSNYLAPVFAKMALARENSALARKADELALTIGALCLIYCIVVFFVGEPLSVFLYGDPLRANPRIITGLAVALSLMAISSPFGIALYALQRSDVNFGSSLASLSIGAAIGVPLIWRFGLPGVPVMAVLAALVDLIIKRAILKRLTRYAVEAASA
jgi:O-antigen/teichoic acid export membrane protein